MPRKLYFASRPAASALLLLLISPAIVQPAQPVTDKARALHERIIVLDSHLDTPAMFDDPKWNILERHLPGDGTNQVDLPRMIEGGLDGGLWVIYTAQRGRSLEDNRVARDHGLKRLLQIHRMVAAYPDRFELALTADDARRIAAAGKRVVFISMENASPLTLDPSLLQFYVAQGLRVLGLVHTSNNEFADSSNATAEWNGLSPRGRELVVEANRLGLVIDHSHASDAVFDQLLELSKTPIILTHTSSDALHDHMRNIDDGRLRKLAAHGGLIQVNGVGSYLKDIRATEPYRAELRALNERYSSAATGSPEYQQSVAQRKALEQRYGISPATFEDYMQHVLHIIDVAGPEHVGFGADWDGGGGVVGFEDVSMLPKVTARLLEAGYTDAQIEAMWGGNLLRLISVAQRVAKELAAVPAAQG